MRVKFLQRQELYIHQVETIEYRLGSFELRRRIYVAEMLPNPLGTSPFSSISSSQLCLALGRRFGNDEASAHILPMVTSPKIVTIMMAMAEL
jgi:hypothetical protein